MIFNGCIIIYPLPSAAISLFSKYVHAVFPITKISATAISDPEQKIFTDLYN